MGKVRAFLIIVVGVFLGGAIPVFLTNLASEEVGWNIWKVPLSTWQIIVTMGIAGIGTWVCATLVPVIIKPSAALKFPEV